MKHKHSASVLPQELLILPPAYAMAEVLFKLKKRWIEFTDAQIKKFLVYPALFNTTSFKTSLIQFSFRTTILQLQDTTGEVSLSDCQAWSQTL